MAVELLPGIGVGHVTHDATGVTAVVCPAGAFAAVDVRGGGPGTRETDLLEAHNTVQQVHAVMLAGGSAYGLAAADGAMQELERQGIGFKVLDDVADSPIVPIVPAAVIFDLLVGDPSIRPTAADGAEAVRRACSVLDQGGAGASVSVGEETPCGSVGAGRGATAGVVRGGYGQATVTSVEGYSVAACVVANPVGSVVDPNTGAVYCRPNEHVDLDAFKALPPLGTKLNTTIGVVATDAPLTKAQAKRLAMCAHDGLARAVRPSHSPLDGDTFFALATGDGRGVNIPTLGALCASAADAVSEAIAQAIFNAEPGENQTSLKEILK